MITLLIYLINSDCPFYTMIMNPTSYIETELFLYWLYFRFYAFQIFWSYSKYYYNLLNQHMHHQQYHNIFRSQFIQPFNFFPFLSLFVEIFHVPLTPYFIPSILRYITIFHYELILKYHINTEFFVQIIVNPKLLFQVIFYQFCIIPS